MIKTFYHTNQYKFSVFKVSCDHWVPTLPLPSIPNLLFSPPIDLTYLTPLTTQISILDYIYIYILDFIIYILIN